MDASPYDDVVGGGDARLAWLLGATRLSAAGGAFRSRRDFVPALQAVSGQGWDESRLSRWESGQVPIPPATVAAYELALELPADRLRSVAILLGPTSATTRTAPPGSIDAAAGAVPRELDALVDVALDGRPTGSHWLRLAEALSRHRAVYMRPDVWQTLHHRLVSETGRSLGHEYLARRAAVRMLLDHPHAEQCLVSALTAYAADPLAPRVADQVSMLQDASDDLAWPALLQLLEDGPLAARRGASRAAATLAAHRRTPPDLRRLEAVVVAGLRADPTALHLADLVHRLPADAAVRIRAAVRDHPALDPVARHGEVVEPELAAAVTGRVTARVREHSDAHPLALAGAGMDAAPAGEGEAGAAEPASSDAMLDRLVREALFHAHEQRRALAAMVLLASPYAAAVAAAAATTLGEESGPVAVRLVQLLRTCATRAELPDVLATAVNGPSETRAQALVALGNNPHVLTLRQAGMLVEHLPWDEPRVEETALYALGMHEMAAVAASHRAADRGIAARAEWWRRAGGRLIDA